MASDMSFVVPLKKLYSLALVMPHYETVRIRTLATGLTDTALLDRHLSDCFKLDVRFDHTDGKPDYLNTPTSYYRVSGFESDEDAVLWKLSNL